MGRTVSWAAVSRLGVQTCDAVGRGVPRTQLSIGRKVRPCIAAGQSSSLDMKAQQDESSFVTISPKILYFGIPVTLVSSMNQDAWSNLAPISSFWALGCTITPGSGR